MRWPCDFSFYSINMIFYINWFPDVELNLKLGGKSHLVMCINLFYGTVFGLLIFYYRFLYLCSWEMFFIFFLAISLASENDLESVYSYSFSERLCVDLVPILLLILEKYCLHGIFLPALLLPTCLSLNLKCICCRQLQKLFGFYFFILSDDLCLLIGS